MEKRYWGYRIDTDNIEFFRDELENNRLRQGWGFNEGQNLRVLKVDEGARRNLSILNKVKKGDILLIPRLPNWNEVAIVEAVDDFDSGYDFMIPDRLKDYGHIFPARLLKSFARNNERVSGKIRATIKNVSRFWNIDHCKDDIESLLQANNSELKSTASYEESFSNAVASSFRSSFDASKFVNNLYESSIKKFSNEEWEYALVAGLRMYFPEPCVVERTGGTLERLHGTDILITLPGLLGYQYLIAIQVKDYSGIVSDDPIKQISKADSYWNQDNRRIIEKVLIITKASKDDNLPLHNNESGVRIIFASELKELLASIGRSFLGLERH